MDISAIFNHPAERLACRTQRDAMTYGELYTRSENLAKAIVQRGAKRVVVYGHKECSMLVAFVACLRAGACYIPCSNTLPHERLVGIANESKADLALCAIGRGFSGSNSIPKENIKRLSQEAPENAPELPTEIDDNELAYMMFTSGHSGRSRGIQVMRKNLNNFINWLDTTFTLEQPGNVLNMSMLMMDLSMIDIYYSLTHGHTLIMTENDLKANHSTLFNHLKISNPDVMVMTPSIADFCIERKEFNTDLMPNLKVIYISGEALHRVTPRGLFERFPNVRIFNAYGATEVTAAVCAAEVTKEMCANPIPIGVPATGACEVVLMDENDQKVEDGKEGEIVIIGDSVSAGYTDGSAGGFFEVDGKRALRTGDIGEIRDGKLYWKARKDSQVKVGGYRLECSDVEINMSRIDGVVSCGAIVQYGHLVAYVVLDENKKNMTPGQIRAAARQYLPQFMIPGIVRILDHLPMNEKDELDRTKLATL